MIQRRRMLTSAVLAGIVFAAPITTSAASPIGVEVLVGDPCISGFGPADRQVTATLRTNAGALRDRVVTRTDRFGSFFLCFGLFIPSTNINGGDVLRIEIGARSRTIEIPNMSPMIDRVQDVIEGRAQPGAPVTIDVAHRNNFRRTRQFFYDVVADSSGHYSVDTTADFNLRGGDGVTVIAQQGNDLFGAFAAVPYIEIGMANNDLLGAVNRGTQLQIVLTDEHALEKAHVTAGPFKFGFFEVEMYADDGSPAYPAGGDTLATNLAADAVLQVPHGYLRGSAFDDVVAGRCMANAPYLFLARNKLFFGVTNSTGRFTRDVGSRLDLRARDDLALICMYPTGDTVHRLGFVR
jgi:hypothetical protein